FVTATPSGWTNDEVGLAWLEQVFDRYTREKARRSWRLLIVDGHGSHITWSFIKYCDRNRVLLLVFLPHSTHTLQPLDVALFSPLGTSYTNQLTEHLHSTQGLVGVKKRNFFRLSYESWTCTFTLSLILKAFEVTGLSPLNAAVIVDRFQNKRRQLPRTPSPIAADNWKQAIQILAQVVENQDVEEVEQLRRTISHLSAHTQLVQLENKGLRNVIRELKPSKSKRSRLDLQHYKEFHSIAVLWSPRKIRQADERYKANKEQKLQEKVDKAHQKELKAQKKLQDERDKRQRRIERERVREDKARKKAADDAEKQRKKQEHDAAKSIQIPKTGKRKASR
ncbi:transposase, partial [Paraphaeosphaeria sporulosa]